MLNVKKQSIFHLPFLLPLQSAPYFMQSDSPGSQWKGYIVDLVQKMADIVPFEFDWLIKDSLGRRHSRSGHWNGMIGELLDQV